jgi:hypothetical protein
VSSFTSGSGYGSLQGIGYGLGFKVVIIGPQTWKKDFPELLTKESNDFKTQQIKIKQELKTIKDKAIQKQYKKEIEKLNRLIKKEAKSQSRLIAMKLYPKLKDEFKKTKDDGKSDALLLGLYVKGHISELVSTGKQRNDEGVC